MKKNLRQLIDEHPDLKKIIDNPELTWEQKQKAIGQYADTLVKNTKIELIIFLIWLPIGIFLTWNLRGDNISDFILLIVALFGIPLLLMFFYHYFKDKKKNKKPIKFPTITIKGHSDADEILKYKNLLDMGAITQDEYNKKKAQILGIEEPLQEKELQSNKIELIQKSEEESDKIEKDIYYIEKSIWVCGKCKNINSNMHDKCQNCGKNYEP